MNMVSDQEIERRRSVAARYQAGLGDLPELTLPPAPGADTRHFDVYQNYELEADRRDELRTHLDKQGVKTIIQCCLPLDHTRVCKAPLLP